MNKNFLKYVVVALFFGSSICSASNLVDEMEHHCKEIINIFVASRANAICGFQKIDAEAWEMVTFEEEAAKSPIAYFGTKLVLA